MGPVRVGNQAYTPHRYDVYGDVVLATAQAFFDHRLLRPASFIDFKRLEVLGEQAVKVAASADAGMWERRSGAKIHTSSSAMCWAGCDRLAKVAAHLNLPDRARYWRQHAQQIHAVIIDRAWNEANNSFVDTFEGNDVDASLLLLAEVGFVKRDDPPLPRHA